jgi:integrase
VGLRVTRGLQWGDLDFEKHTIHVRRSWVLSAEGKGKTKLAKSDMPMHPVLAEAMQEWHRDTLYHRDSNWVRLVQMRWQGSTMRFDSGSRPFATRCGQSWRTDV